MTAVYMVVGFLGFRIIPLWFLSGARPFATATNKNCWVGNVLLYYFDALFSIIIIINDFSLLWQFSLFVRLLILPCESLFLFGEAIAKTSLTKKKINALIVVGLL